MFIEGSVDNFLGMGLQIYDIVFVNYVYWILDKKLVFMNMFSSLKLIGKIVLQFNDYIFFLNDYVYCKYEYVLCGNQIRN